MSDGDATAYDEFSFLESYARHEGMAWPGPPEVRRVDTAVVGKTQRLSALRWGGGAPAIVLLHGAGQNAHTWDSVALALGRPVVALDLPGHGHSDWRDDGDYRPPAIAAAVADALEQLAPKPAAIVGMSLGGLATIRLAAKHPHIVPRAVVVDATPSMGGRVSPTAVGRDPVTLLRGPKTFKSFEAMLAAVGATRPGRPAESLRPGLLHNSRQLPDGSWAWRYDPRVAQQRGTQAARELAAAELWDDLEAITAPVMLVLGELSHFVNDDERAQFARLQPRAKIELVPGASHVVQSDRPLALARLIAEFTADS